MDYQIILNFIQQYGYWIIYPLMIIEGPIITIIGSGLASLGILKIEIVFALSVIGDLTMDIILYHIGLHGNTRLKNWISKRPAISQKKKMITTFFKKQEGKMIFLAKISSGLCYITFITAGMTKMSFKKFVLFSAIGGVIWSGVLVYIGYFYGHLYQEIGDKIEQAGVLILTTTILTFILITILKKKIAPNTVLK